MNGKVSTIVVGLLVCAAIVCGQDYGREGGFRRGGLSRLGGLSGGSLGHLGGGIVGNIGGRRVNTWGGSGSGILTGGGLPFPGGYCPDGTSGYGSCQYDAQCGAYQMCYLAASSGLSGFGATGTCCRRQGGGVFPRGGRRIGRRGGVIGEY